MRQSLIFGNERVSYFLQYALDDIQLVPPNNDLLTLIQSTQGL